MKRSIVLVVALATALALVAPAGAAEAPNELPQLVKAGGSVDDLPSPLSDAQREARQTALESVVHAKTSPSSDGVAEVAHGQFVELERQGEDLIWTVLGEFGELDSPFGAGSPAGDLTSGIPGPLHNEIAEPDRSVDNTTIWTEDFSKPYYEGILFENDVSVRHLYEEMSSNRYSVSGEVEDWAQVPYNAAHYGRETVELCGSPNAIVCSNTWWFVQDSVNAWYQDQIDAGMSDAEINDYLSQFDVWDRYDWDGDGNFDEPDGYIDHFQVVHAGEGQEAGGGAQGADAIWSHRWYAYFNLIGSEGPSPDYLLGGVQVGDTDFWVGDYTIEPENGGVGVFAHEFAHDLGLPDLYDTSGNVGGAENSTGFWTLMSSGSWMNDGTVDIGSRPDHMGMWEKFQLGWLDYEVAVGGQKSTHKLGPSTTTTKQAQGLFVLLPDKEVVEQIAVPEFGENFYYSGAGNNLDNFMYRSFNLSGGEKLTAKVNYDIEVDWDYAYVVVSTDGGNTWTGVDTNHSDNAGNPNGQDFGHGISGSTGGNWVDLETTEALPTGEILVGFRYWTDVAVVEPGFMVDQIMVGAEGPFGAEEDDGWTLDGFRVTSGTETNFYFNAYAAEFRQYRGEDETLETGPYNFGFLDNPDLQNWVEHFPYQDGLLISYWDTSFANNNVGSHCADGRCGGLILPIDAHPDLMIRPDNGEVWRARVQSWDSTFGLEATDEICLHMNSVEGCYGGDPAVPVFDDTNDYWVPPDPSIGHKGWASVPVPKTGTRIQVLNTSARGNFMQVLVR